MTDRGRARPSTSPDAASAACPAVAARARTPSAPVRPDSRLTGATLLAIFDAQARSRQLDLDARWLQQQGRGFYTIGSAGHEGNAAVAAALRPPTRRCCTTGPARSTWPAPHQVPGIDPRPRRPARAGRVRRRADRRRPAQGVRPGRAGHHPADLDDRLAPAAGARCRAWRSTGRPSSACQPVAARRGGGYQLRRRLGQPLHRGRRDQRRLPRLLPGPAGARCCWSARTTGSGSACPPRRAGSAAAYGDRPGLSYFAADGCDPVATYDAAVAAARLRAVPAAPRVPAPVHGPLPRPRRQRRGDGLPHARGRWPPTSTATRWWRPPARWSRRPAHPGRGGGPLRRGRRAGPRRGRAGDVARRPLASAAEVMAPLAPAPPGPGGRRPRGPAARRRTSGLTLGGKLPEPGSPLTLAQHQPRARRAARDLPRHVRVRRGRRAQGRRVRRDQGPAAAVRGQPGVRHPARRAVHPRRRAGRRSDRSAAGARDPVPGVPAQRRGPATRRGC